MPVYSRMSALDLRLTSLDTKGKYDTALVGEVAKDLAGIANYLGGSIDVRLKARALAEELFDKSWRLSIPLCSKSIEEGLPHPTVIGGQRIHTPISTKLKVE